MSCAVSCAVSCVCIMCVLLRIPVLNNIKYLYSNTCMYLYNLIYHTIYHIDILYNIVFEDYVILFENTCMWVCV